MQKHMNHVITECAIYWYLQVRVSLYTYYIGSRSWRPRLVNRCVCARERSLVGSLEDQGAALPVCRHRPPRLCSCSRPWTRLLMCCSSPSSSQRPWVCVYGEAQQHLYHSVSKAISAQEEEEESSKFWKAKNAQQHQHEEEWWQVPSFTIILERKLKTTRGQTNVN